MDFSFLEFHSASTGLGWSSVSSATFRLPLRSTSATLSGNFLFSVSGNMSAKRPALVEKAPKITTGIPAWTLPWNLKKKSYWELHSNFQSWQMHGTATLDRYILNLQWGIWLCTYKEIYNVWRRNGSNSSKSWSQTYSQIPNFCGEKFSRVKVSNSESHGNQKFAGHSNGQWEPNSVWKINQNCNAMI